MRRRTASLLAAVGCLAAAGGIAAVISTSSPPAAKSIVKSKRSGSRATTYEVPKGATLLATIHRTVADYTSPVSPSTGTVAPTWDGAPVTLPVIAQRPGWLDVRLPQRPNGTTTWLRSSEVSLTYTPYRIVVDEATTHLELERYGRVIESFPAGIGSPSDPTPTGEYFVAYFAQPPSSGYGPFVIVTSAHSDAITDWEHSGDAEIAIHGPLGLDAEIGTSGARISHGCVRLHDSDLEELRPIPVGTPVDILRN